MSGECSGGDVAVVTKVMVEGGANLPAVNFMCVKGGSVGGHFVE